MKQSIFWESIRCIQCFYSTYEELKLNWAIGLFPCSISFYSTYEELKLDVNSCTHSVITLFLQYLWGIETNLFFVRGYFRILFLQYLWGIETHFITIKCFSKSIVFTVPMRNWNVHILFQFFLILLGFYSTYEELKPPWAVVNILCFFCFYSTYEELKH